MQIFLRGAPKPIVGGAGKINTPLINCSKDGSAICKCIFDTFIAAALKLLILMTLAHSLSFVKI